MKNKNKWLLTSNTHKGIKHIKPCPYLMGKDQFVLFMNGFPQKGVNDYDSLVTLVGSLADCVQCHKIIPCNICLTIEELNENFFVLNLNPITIILYSAILYDQSDIVIIDFTEGIIPIQDEISIPILQLYGNISKRLTFEGYDTTGLCFELDFIIISKDSPTGITEFDIENSYNDILENCDGELIVDAILIPNGGSYEFDLDTYTITLINTETSVDNKFIFGFYCDGCLIGLYTVSSR